MALRISNNLLTNRYVTMKMSFSIFVNRENRVFQDKLGPGLLSSLFFFGGSLLQNDYEIYCPLLR